MDVYSLYGALSTDPAEYGTYNEPRELELLPWGV